MTPYFTAFFYILRRFLRRNEGDTRLNYAVFWRGWLAIPSWSGQPGAATAAETGCRAIVQRIPAQIGGPSTIGIGGITFHK